MKKLRSSAASGAILWIAGLTAFQPVWVDLVAHWMAQPWARYSLVFALLWPLCLVRGDRREWPEAAPSEGLAWLGCGLAFELAGVAAGIPFVGRPGLAFALVGLARWTGRARYPAVFLACFLIPIPQALVEVLTGRAAVVAQYQLGADLLRPWMVPLHVEWPFAATADTQLRLRPVYAGVPLAVGLVGIGLYRAIRRGALSAGALGRRLGFWLLLWLPLQAVAVLQSVFFVAQGRPAWAANSVEWMPLCGLAIGVAAHTEWPRSESPHEPLGDRHSSLNAPLTERF